MNNRVPMENLQQAYAEAADALPACPTAEEIRRFQEGGLSEERAFVLEFHLNDCAECIELMERIEAGAGGPELEPAVESRLEEEIAAQLGLRSAPPVTRLRDYVSRFLAIRTPIYVPAAAAALLLALVLVPRGTTEPAPSTGTLPVSSIIIDQAELRSSDSGSRPATAQGDIVLIEVFLESLENLPGTPVTCTLLDGGGRVMLVSETAILEDYNIRVALRLAEAGTFTVQFATADGNRPLETVHINVAP
jgi:hypothetical protein